MVPTPDFSTVPRVQKTGWAAVWVAVATCSALFFFGSGLHPLWWLTWFAPAPILLVSFRVNAWRAFGVSALAWILGSMNMVGYLRNALGLPIPVVFLISAVPACVFALAVLMYRRFARQGAVWRAGLVFPTMWVTYEYLNSLASPHSTAGNLGYSQMNCLAILQIASVTGIWGISFCLFVFAAALAILVGRSGAWKSRQRFAIVVGLLLTFLIGFGFWRLRTSSQAEGSIRVGMMSTGDVTLFPHDDASALDLLRKYAESLDKITQKVDVIVLPEKIALVSDAATAQVDDLFKTTARRIGADIVVGVDRGTRTKRFNEARMYSPDGSLAATYDKHHMIPMFEAADQPGTTITVLDQPSGIWGIEICKDMDFPDLSREYGARGVGLLLVPAWDFVTDGWLHGRMAVMRGVESGFTIVRAARQGVLSVSDDRGRILAEKSAPEFFSLFASAPIRHNRTLYARWGDWFARLNIAGLLLVLSLPRKRPD